MVSINLGEQSSPGIHFEDSSQGKKKTSTEVNVNSLVEEIFILQ
jgi:hypothetical protein